LKAPTVGILETKSGLGKRLILKKVRCNGIPILKREQIVGKSLTRNYDSSREDKVKMEETCIEP
jgi:hypothetical protein